MWRPRKRINRAEAKQLQQQQVHQQQQQEGGQEEEDRAESMEEVLAEVIGAAVSDQEAAVEQCADTGDDTIMMEGEWVVGEAVPEEDAPSPDEQIVD
jgi:hypothetical protein